MSKIQFLNWLPTLLEGLKVTLLSSMIAIVTSVLLGALVAILVAYNNKFLSAVMRVYISIFRNTPLLVILFFLFYGLPMIKITLPALVCGVIGITLNESAFVAEIIRGAIKDVPPGEVEAAVSLGLSKTRVVNRLIFPLAFRNSIPILTGQSSVIIKDTSLFSLIMVLDLMRAGSKFYEDYLNSTSIWVIAFIYVAIFLLITQIGRILEKRAMVRR